MITVSILEKDDIVLASDWCRPLVLQTMSGGMSDSMSFKSCYSGTPENNVEWVRADCVFGSVWFSGSSTPAKFKACGLRYEFVRGDIPKSHQLSMADFTDLRKFE